MKRITMKRITMKRINKLIISLFCLITLYNNEAFAMLARLRTLREARGRRLPEVRQFHSPTPKEQQQIPVSKSLNQPQTRWGQFWQWASSKLTRSPQTTPAKITTQPMQQQSWWNKLTNIFKTTPEVQKPQRPSVPIGGFDPYDTDQWESIVEINRIAADLQAVAGKPRTTDVHNELEKLGNIEAAKTAVLTTSINLALEAVRKGYVIKKIEGIKKIGDGILVFMKHNKKNNLLLDYQIDAFISEIDNIIVKQLYSWQIQEKDLRYFYSKTTKSTLEGGKWIEKPFTPQEIEESVQQDLKKNTESKKQLEKVVDDFNQKREALAAQPATQAAQQQPLQQPVATAPAKSSFLQNIFKSTEEIKREEHTRKLDQILADPNNKEYIAQAEKLLEISGKPNTVLRPTLWQSLRVYPENSNMTLIDTLQRIISETTYNNYAKSVKDLSLLLDSLSMILNLCKKEEFISTTFIQDIGVMVRYIRENALDINKSLGRSVFYEISAQAKEKLTEKQKLAVDFGFKYHNAKNKEEFLAQPGNQEKFETLKKFGLDNVIEDTKTHMEYIEIRDKMYEELVKIPLKKITAELEEVGKEFNIKREFR